MPGRDATDLEMRLLLVSSSTQTVFPVLAGLTPHLSASASTRTNPNPDSSSSAGVRGCGGHGSASRTSILSQVPTVSNRSSRGSLLS